MNLIVIVKLILPQQTAFHKSRNVWEAVLGTVTIICLVLINGRQWIVSKGNHGQSKFVLATDKQ